MTSRNKREGTYEQRRFNKRMQQANRFGTHYPDDGKYRWVRMQGLMHYDLFHGAKYTGLLMWNKGVSAYVFYMWHPSIYVPQGTHWYEAQAYIVARLRMES